MRVVKLRRGDTLIEVMFAITVFALVAVMSVSLMNGGINTAQKSLEVTMARNEIDAQAEALRFIQHSYLAEKELTGKSREFTDLWDELTNVGSGLAQVPSDELTESFNNMASCEEAYEAGGQVLNGNAFVLNTRLMQPNNSGRVDVNGMSYAQLMPYMIVGVGSGKLKEAPLYPRVLFTGWGDGVVNDEDRPLDELPTTPAETYREVAQAEGIWVVAVLGNTDADATPSEDYEPEFYDFYIRTCWHSIGRRVPSTIGSIVRLYNPEVIE